MRRVLADLTLDLEAAAALAFRTAEAFDAGDRPFARIAVALAKYLNNARCPTVTFEAMQALGGMGYVEETPMPWLYREAPLNAIWEGSGNVICLDVLRTMAKDAPAADALADALDRGRGADTRYDAALETHRRRWSGLPPEADARSFTEASATLLAAATLLERAPTAVAEGFITSRLEPRGLTTGAVGDLDEVAILDRLGPPH